ncbi:hypothetical protein QCA50_004363 [Cerrena zonata]|uniref:Csf1 N-terminal domain-containing protein n=1 Tax=Cerrena zonata TaxID=2478898 RepID=A0AAW0GHH1_9APHY
MLNVVLLIICICIIIAVISYLFYLNRFVGFLLGLGCRIAFWNSGETSIWVSIGSISFSVLAGRISFKDLRYHSANQTILVVKGQISWRYWIRVPVEEDDLIHARVIGEGIQLKSKTPLSCRVNISLQGLEWSLYNRTAAYETIIASMEASDEHPEHEHESRRPSGDGIASVRKIFSRSSAAPDSSILGPPGSLISSLYRKAPSFLRKTAAWIRAQLPNLDPRDLLPVGLEATTAAITLGNPSTPHMLVAEFSKANGTYGVVPARSKHDFYRQVLNITFKDASIRYLENANYQQKMSDQGRQIHTTIQRSQHPTFRHLGHLSFPIFQKLWKHLKLWKHSTNPFSKPPKPTFPHPAASWNRRKAAKSSEDATPLGADFEKLEYAKEPKILECPRLELLYYADVVGVVPMVPEAAAALDPQDIGNGDVPPEWGIDLALNGGSLRYGPWADRQRAHLQQTFFPSMFQDVTPHARLRPGDMRMWTHFKLFLELREGVVLQVPFREASKNWQWDGKFNVPNRPKLREAASIHVKAGDTSTITYLMPMNANSRGYEPTLEVHLDTVSITTSLNDIRLLQAGSCRVRADLPSPLSWRGERQWTFGITLRQPVIYLLRDHANMLSDLGRDWASGPPGDYHRFIPMLYAVEVDLQAYELNTYVNDQNIIDKPLIREENALLTLHGARLVNSIRIPLTKFRPVSTAVSFTIDAPDVGVRLSLPRWNTHSIYPIPHRTEIGRIGNFHLDASYRYFAEVHSEDIDQLILNFTLRDIAYKACGWTMRHFMILRDNYFGTFTHFSTLIEYLHKVREGKPPGDPIEMQYREGASNTVQVQLTVDVDYGVMVLPAGLSGYETFNVNEAHNLDDIDIGASLVLVLPSLQLQLRAHRYYMEMSLGIDTIYGHCREHVSERLLLQPASRIQGREDLVIDGLHITANRLFGPQPHTTTYVCIWEIQILSIKAILSSLKARILGAAISALGYSFIDPLNAPASEFVVPVDPDVNFLKVSLGSANIVWNAGSTAVELAIPNGLRFESNDAAGKSYAKVSSVRVPSMTAKALLASPTTSNLWYEAAQATADAYLDIYSAPPGWRERAAAQTAFIAEQDAETRRVAFLYDPQAKKDPGRYATSDIDPYLPPLRVPGMDDAPKSRSRRMLAGFGQTLHPPQTDSEDEPNDGVDPDVKVANSRPTTQRTEKDVDAESMSIGDESDDADLTELDTDSEDDIASIDNEQGPWSSLRSFTRWTTRYSTPSLLRPSYWRGSPYIKERSCLFPRLKPLVINTEHIDLPPQEPLIPEEDRDTSDSTFIRFHNKSGIWLQITPLISPVVKVLVAERHTNQLGPELRFDSIMINYVKSLSAAAIPSMSSTGLDVDITSLQLDMSQTLGGQIISKETGLYAAHHPLSFVSLRTDGLKIRIETATNPKSSETLALHTSFDLLSLRLSKLSKSTALNESMQQEPCFSLSRTIISLNRKNVAISLGQSSVVLDHSIPDLAANAALGILHYAQPTLEDLKRSSEAVRHEAEQYLFTIIHLSRDRPIADYLSAFQPSYLIQSGRPHHARTDIAFKLLVYFRLSLPNLEPSHRQYLLRPSAYAASNHTPLEIKSIVETQLQQAGMEYEDSVFPLQTVFPDVFRDDQTNVPPSAKSAIPLDLVRLNFEGLQLVLNHGPASIRTEFSGSHLGFSGSMRRGQWLQPTDSPVKTTSTWSARESGSQEMNHIAVVASFGNVTFMLYPQILEFVQILIRVTREFTKSLCSSQPVVLPSDDQSSTSKTVHRPLLSIDVVLTSKTFQLKAAAESLIIDYRATDVVYSSNTIMNSSQTSQDMSTNQTVAFRELKLQACSTIDPSKLQESVALALITLDRGNFNVVYKTEESSTLDTLKGVARLEGIHLNVPRSAMRLYRFAEEWQADYLPRFDSTMRALLAEIGANGSTPRPQLPKHESSLSIALHLEVTSLRVSLQVMRGTWLSWEICRMVSYFTSPGNLRPKIQAFGLQVGSQNFRIVSRPKRDATEDIRVKFDLPAFILTGRHNGTHLHCLALIDYFHFIVKPSHWDTLLSVQQKFGRDFNDFLLLVEETRGKREVKPFSPTSSPLQYDVSVKVEGFRVGLEGLTSTLFLECENVTGGISDTDMGTKRQFNLFDITLSLASQSTSVNSKTSLDRDRRSAFVSIDSQVAMEGKGEQKRLNINVAKIHAVMQPSSIGEIGDFVDHLQAEIAIRQEQRATELAEFREKTRSVMRTFEAKIGDPQQDADRVWWDEYNIKVAVHNIGIAFPLAANPDLQLPRSGSLDSSAVRAFLFSTKSVVFDTEKGETGKVKIEDFSFQFVSSFRQSVSSDFSGHNHSTRNRLVYPKMTAKLRMERMQDSRRIRVGADVDGFILDIDSSIPDYVFSLIDVYREGKERVSRLTGAIPRSPAEPQPPVRAQSLPTSQQYGALLTSNLLASMVFASGKVRMYSKKSRPGTPRTKSASSVTDAYETSRIERDAEVFKLPVVSVWCEYRATPALAKSGNSSDSVHPSILLFKSTIHSSQNTLRPTLLPFLTELVGRTETHIRGSNLRDSPPTSQTLLASQSGPVEKPEPVADTVSSMQISLSLRIDQSKLELTCQPDVNVIAGLHWDSGGFVVNISPGARRVTFTGSVGGLTAGLKHGFLSEDCVKLDARNLAFTMNFAKVDHKSGKSTSSVSVVLDTEFGGGVRFSRLQDVLCFKAVWLDRIPLLAGQNSAPASTISRFPSDMPVPETPKEELVTAVLIRLRSVKLQIDLGQSITSMELTLDNTLIRTKVSDASSELSLSVASFTVIATGNLTGSFRVPDFRFETVRRNGMASQDDKGWMLNLTITSGPLDIELDSEYHKLLVYRADPLKVMIFDDWSKLSQSLPPAERRVGMIFTVTGGEALVVMNVGTIPKLVMYANKFTANLETQREGARRESQTVRRAFAAEPDNPLSAMATAMLNTAKTRVKEAENALTCIVEQRMSLRLKFLRLVVFPRNMRDVELAHFIGSDIHARLDRVVESDLSPASRKLHLSFSSMSVSRMSQLNHSLPTQEAAAAADSKKWLASLLNGSSEATIFGLPSMNMWMQSQETTVGNLRSLEYDFSSTFKNGTKDPEDIYITLNMSLYSWLTVLRKTFAREMDQLQASAEARNTGAPSVSSLQRKRATADAVTQPNLPEPLDLPKTGSRMTPALSHSKSYSLAIPSVGTGSENLLPPTNPGSPITSATTSSHASNSIPEENSAATVTGTDEKKRATIVYKPRTRHIERLTMRQLGEATPDVMHPFFMKKAGFSLEDSLPQYVHEYAALPTEEIMKVLLRLYSRQLKVDQTHEMK